MEGVRVRRVALVFGAALSLVGAQAGAPSGCAAPPVEAVLVAQGLATPMFVTAPRGDPRLFVLERSGTIRIVTNGALRTRPFLDLRSRVSTEGEGGLLGLAFPLDAVTSGVFYVYYTACDTRATSGAACSAGVGRFRSILSRFHASGDLDVADAGSEEVLLDIAQPFTNHNGGTIALRPTDGMLYLGPGDGGWGNDPDEVAQSPESLLGKMLRIDVRGPGGYAVPSSNPLFGRAGARGEIWSFGLRNPYRWSFDRETGDLWIGDVGQGQREEVDFEAAGGSGGVNHGWDVMEGSLCNSEDPAPSPPCGSETLTAPVVEYAHDGRCAIVGGVVYRGVIPELRGRYLFGDYCNGSFFSLDPVTRAVSDLTGPLLQASRDHQLSSIGEDGFGEVYVTNLGGSLYRIRSTLPDGDHDGVPDVADDCTEEPNGPLARDAGGNVQLDSDGDGYGNACDADLDADGSVSFGDLALMKRHFFTANGPADLDGDGWVDFGDLARMKAAMFRTPGPSGLRP